MSGDGRGWEKGRPFLDRGSNAAIEKEKLLAVGKRRRKREALRGINFELLRKNNSRKKNLRCDDVLLSKEFFLPEQKKTLLHMSLSPAVRKRTGRILRERFSEFFSFKVSAVAKLSRDVLKGEKETIFFAGGDAPLVFISRCFFGHSP